MTRGKARTPPAGFTLVEILLVVVILGILASLAQPRLLSAITAAREAVLKQNLFVLRDVIDQYYADHGAYPPSLAKLVESRYLRRIPIDPMTESAESWVLEFYRDEDGREQGIYDVRSGSDGVARDGTKYREW